MTRSGRSEVLWSDPARAARSRLSDYRNWLADARGLKFAGYEELYAWSIRDLEAFWSSIWDYFGIASSSARTAVLVSDAMPGARWFPGARLNYAEHALRHPGGERAALVQADERGVTSELSWDSLRSAVGSLAHALRARGITPGDVVAGYLPNCSEAAIAFLACASIGAVWTSCSPDVEPSAARDRFAQLRPKLLVVSDGYRFAGREHDRRAAAAELAEHLSTIETVVLVTRIGAGELPRVSAEPWSVFLSETHEPEFAQVPFDHPLYVLFSSGTTGAPKGIVHGHGGQLLDHVRHHALHLDLGSTDRFCWYTTTSWMVWNWLVAGLLVGSTVVLYDGSPRHPALGTQFALAELAQVTVLGTSASYLTACAMADVKPGRDNDLTHLRTLASTASPLPRETFRWVSESVGRDVWLVSASGGTDICSAFVSGCIESPVRAGEIQSRCLGAAVDVFDEQGGSIVGEVGELVLTRPLPSMPVGFWDDPNGERYRDAYFSRYPGVWRHGDWAVLHSDGACEILGRSDSTLNRHGIRIGTAEIYAAVEAVEGVEEALVVGIEQPDGGYWMPLFVALDNDQPLTDTLEASIRTAIRAAASPRHVPDEVIQVPAIPRTRTGKKLEVPIKRFLMGAAIDDVVNRGALANPSSLDAFVEVRCRSTTG